MKIREAIESDIPALTHLYNYYIQNTVITFDIEPFTIEERTDWFLHYNRNERHRLLVAEEDQQLLGYATSSSFHPKKAYETSVETSIYLVKGDDGKGVGTKLYASLFDHLATADVKKAYAGITVPNDASIALHRKFKFIKAGVYTEVGRKFGQYHNVEWWEKHLK